MKIFGIIIATVSGLILLSYLTPQPEIFVKVKNNELTLECEFEDGWRTVDADKVISYDEETGYWTFTNGYAKHCDTY